MGPKQLLALVWLLLAVLPEAPAARYYRPRYGRCKPDDFICDDGKCIEGSRKCNNVMDCNNNEDERNCPCEPGEFRCGDGTCIEGRKRCDDNPNCNDLSDEMNCKGAPGSVSSGNNSWSGVHVCASRGQFMCGDGSCLSVLVRCDGFVNCPKDSADEHGCPCTPDQWQCDFGLCIARSKRCDGHVDCPTDRSDERHCGACQYSDFVCKNGVCIPEVLRCNGITNCNDGSDEDNCPEPRECMHYQAECSSGGCVDRSLLCDGSADCADGSDEYNCPCSRESFRCSNGTCINIDQRCNGRRDCPRGEDEVRCAGECTPESFRCDDGSCIRDGLKCNGESDCPDGSDESRCEPTVQCDIRCGDGSCVDNSKRCDGIIDCNDRYDERDCTCRSDDFRCDNAQCIPRSGVCDGVADCTDQSDENEATCAPRRQECDENSFRCDEGTCIPGDLECNREPDCPDLSDEYRCQDVACRPNEFTCARTRKCIQADFRCDGHLDCTDSSDEENCDFFTEAPPQACSSSNFSCDGICFPMSIRCDGKPDCSNEIDEQNCENSCPDTKYSCPDGSCIVFTKVCDGYLDCTDGSDENECPGVRSQASGCMEAEFACDSGGCIPHIRRCDNVYDCRDFSDEQNCFNSECQAHQWHCKTGECIHRRNLCDGTADCADGSDERDPSCQPTTTAPLHRPPPPPPVTSRPPWNTDYERCHSDEWRCENGPCIQGGLHCNGNVDCPYDNSDELDCPSVGELNLKTYPTDQIIRETGDVVFQCRDEGMLRARVSWSREGGRPLPAGAIDKNGRLEIPSIQVSDSGNYICKADDYPRSFPGSQKTVYLQVEPEKSENYHPTSPCKMNESTCSNGDCIPKSSVCNGIHECTDGSDEMGCNLLGQCEPNQFKCANRRCVLKIWLCDAEDDCQDGSDEALCGPQDPYGRCKPHEFQCRTGDQCIQRSYHCDKEKDCADGSDEEGCLKVYISQPPPPMMILDIHQTFTVTCKAVGTPIPEINWRLNWGHIPEKCTTTSIDGVGTLTCPDIQVQDQGAYSCEAMNNQGTSFAIPDTILTVNQTLGDICPAGYFNSEARVAQDCISCFCFGASTQCRSADLFTYQLPPPLNQGGAQLTGVIKPAGQSLQITDEPISDMFDYKPQYNGAIIRRIGQWSPRNIFPYLSLPETYCGSQLTSYGGYIKYTVVPQSNSPPPPGYSPLPDIIIKGGDNLLTYNIPQRARHYSEYPISVQLFQGEWQKVTPYGQQLATREDIMMILAEINQILLRAEESGHGVEFRDFQMDSAGTINTGQGSAAFVEECTCPQGYSGLSCQKCSPGYTRVSSGRWLGRCTRVEPPCQPGYYGNPTAGTPCRPCPCPLTTPSNQFSRTCSLASDGEVVCDCPTGYEGRRCEYCSSGYRGNPTVPGDSCRKIERPSSVCDARGTAREENGICHCKNNVVGQRCSQCAPESFYLSSDNSFGCSKCFCMGVTGACTSSTWKRTSISSRFGSSTENVRLVEVSQDSSRVMDSHSLTTNKQNQEVTFRGFSMNNPNNYYWSLPDRFLGDKVTAYGGYLNYTIRHVSNSDGSKDNAADLQIISKNDITLEHFSNAVPSSNGYLSGSVQISEQYWKRRDGVQTDREHIIMALADLEEILIKATYTSRTQQASLASVSLEIADERGSGDRAIEIEQCQCPPGYLGTSCEDCAPGYTRGTDGLYLGVCELCSCNGHSDQCHPDTGECLNCQHNTAGEFCESCAPRFYGNATAGTPEDCSSQEATPECRCNPAGTQEPVCRGNNRCSCKINVQGQYCDSCRKGTFKLSNSSLHGCTECYCSGVTNQCDEASHLYRQQIPIAIMDDQHGFALSSIDQKYIIDSNFQLNVPLNQLGYNFGRVSPFDRLFWSLPGAFTGNKILSYNGEISITQKFDTAERQEVATDDTDVLLVGGGSTLYWKKPEKLRSNMAIPYTVPLSENYWKTLATGEPPRPVSRADFMLVLSDLKQILVRATPSPNTTATYIADVSMDTAIPAQSGQAKAENIEACICPVGYTGTSCETCTSGYYRNAYGKCERCPCSNNEESCQLGANNAVICYCRPEYGGDDCSYPGAPVTSEPIVRPPPVRPSIRVEIMAPSILNKETGETAQFVCTARSSHSPSPRVVWTKEGGTLPLGRQIQDSAAGTLKIKDVRASDSGTYLCTARDSYSTGTDRATLIVPQNDVSPPRVSIQPPSLEVFEGEPIEIRCVVSGNPSPTLSWVRSNRRPLNPEHTFSDGVFSISSARQSDQGEYRCVAKNSGGQDIKNAVIYVNPRPEAPKRPAILTVNPPEPVVREGDSLTIVCSADQNIQSKFITWTGEDGQIPRNFRSANGQLVIERIRPEDGGVYTCSADRAPERVQSTTVVITVQRYSEPPNTQGSVRVEREMVTVPEGQSVTVKCEPIGNPQLIIGWTKEDADFGPGVSQRGNTLVISQAKVSDRGVYVCVGSTSDGNSIAQAQTYITIEKREIPSVTIWPTNSEAVLINTSHILHCYVDRGIPEPVITWSRASGRPLTSNTHLKAGGVLSFSSITLNEEGAYICTASNVAGEGTATANIIVQSPPELVVLPDTDIVTQPGKELTLECRASGHPVPLVYWMMESPQKRVLTSKTPSLSTLTLTSVEDDARYVCVGENVVRMVDEMVRVTIQDNDIDSDTGPTRGDISGPVPSRVTVWPQSYTLQEGDSLQINCTGSLPNMDISWTKVDSPKYLQTQPTPGGLKLELSSVTEDDAGIYRCEGRDRNGAPRYDEFTLNVQRSQTRPINSGNGEFISDDPQVFSAELGNTVRMPCSTQLAGPVYFEWERPYSNVPRRILTRSPMLELRSLNETDAGPYVCRVSNGETKMEMRVILKVTHVVPGFSGDGSLTLDNLKDAYLFFDIELSIKPQGYHGLILFNSEKNGNMGDYISLALVGGIPEFQFALGIEPPVVIRGNRPLTLNQWHTIKISRSKNDGYMYIDGQGPFNGTYKSKAQGLDLNEPLYIGGVPDPSILPQAFTPKTGFVGCIGKLVLENNEKSLMKEAINKININQCDSCSQNQCQNNAICQEALTDRGYTCICPAGLSGLDCNRQGDACQPGLCGQGRCSDTVDGFKCYCPIGYVGERCESHLDIEYPSFGGEAFLAFATPKTTKYLDMSLKLKPMNPVRDGLVLYCAESIHGHGDFTSVSVKDGYLEFRFDFGSGPTILRSAQPLTPDEWVTVEVTRRINNGTLKINSEKLVTLSSSVKEADLNLRTPLYVGGYDSELLTINKGAGVTSGFSGCISDVKVHQDQLDIVNAPIKSANVWECGSSESSHPRRGDITEEYSPPESEDSVCSHCQNGGFCRNHDDRECECPPEYRGAYCEISRQSPTRPNDALSPCDVYPCQGGGTCRPTLRSLYKCDCPLGTGGFNCQDRVRLHEDLSLAGEGYVELPSHLMMHDDPGATEIFAIAFTTTSPDGLLLLQTDTDANLKEGDFLLVNINVGYVELQWELGNGVGKIQNNRVNVFDDRRHRVIMKKRMGERRQTEFTLEVDGEEDFGRDTGMQQVLNSNSNYYIGGVPSNMTQIGLIGFSGCIHQIELQNPHAIDIGRTAVASRNANPCTNSFMPGSLMFWEQFDAVESPPPVYIPHPHHYQPNSRSSVCKHPYPNPINYVSFLLLSFVALNLNPELRIF